MFRRTLLATPLLATPALAQKAAPSLLHVSYDPTRELFADLNPMFARIWQARAGATPQIRMSHSGSGAQARAVIDGLEADLVTLALQPDIDALARAGLVAPGWRDRLPNRAVPWTSTIVFVVRRGNPKSILDWPDLLRPGTAIITPNPKTSGGARWIYLAAWGWALRQGRDPQATLAALFRNVPILDTGARAATITFARRNQGDALLAWEDDATLAVREAAGRLEIVRPSLTIVAEPVAALVDRIADRRGSRTLADAYLRFLWTEDAQDVIARHAYRPASPTALARANLPTTPSFRLEDHFTDWPTAQRDHFAEGGTFDRLR